MCVHLISILLSALAALFAGGGSRSSGGCCGGKAEVLLVEILELVFPFVSAVDLQLWLKRAVCNVSKSPFSVASEDLSEADQRVGLLNKL